jgi:teichuronic acid biosynthesis glycosyltransferase TuaH
MNRLHSIRQALFPPGSRREAFAEPLLDLLRDFWYAPFDSRLGCILPAAMREPLRRNFYRHKEAALAGQQAELRKILDKPTAATAVFLPGLDWEAQLIQRPQQLGRALARQGAQVFYLLPEPWSPGPAFQQVEPNLYLCRTPVAAFRLLERPWVYTLTWNRKYLLALESPRILYDYVDDLSVIPSNLQRMQRYHSELLKNAAVVTVTSRRLFSSIQAVRPDACYLPNGVEYEHFAPARQPRAARSEPPPDLAPIVERGRPVIGYYGALAFWFDYTLYREVAGLRPRYEFVLIGPALDSSLVQSGLLALPNVHWLERKPYAGLPGYLAWFDAATIPFVISELTHAVSPVKLFEYFAGGKPVVATPMEETVQYPGVLAAQGAADFAARLDQALRLANDPANRASILAIAQQNTWDFRAQELLKTL